MVAGGLSTGLLLTWAIPAWLFASQWGPQLRGGLHEARPGLGRRLAGDRRERALEADPVFDVFA